MRAGHRLRELLVAGPFENHCAFCWCCCYLTADKKCVGPGLRKGEILCGNGDVRTDWTCGPGRGGRVACPPSAPYLCATTNKCGAGKVDRCCNKDFKNCQQEQTICPLAQVGQSTLYSLTESFAAVAPCGVSAQIVPDINSAERRNVCDDLTAESILLNPPVMSCCKTIPHASF